MNSRRISDFISLYDRREGIIADILKEAREADVPVLRDETAMFLETLVAALSPVSVLELGTAVGYSAAVMAKASESIKRIDTIEDWGPRIPIARENIERAGLRDIITIHEGDALEVMKSLTGPYDLVFIDAAKGQYPDYLGEAMRLTEKGSAIVADNIFCDGDILESRYAVERRDRTIHKRMRDFLDELFSDDRLKSSIVPVGDGITVSVRTA